MRKMKSAQRSAFYSKECLPLFASLDVNESGAVQELDVLKMARRLDFEFPPSLRDMAKPARWRAFFRKISKGRKRLELSAFHSYLVTWRATQSSQHQTISSQIFDALDTNGDSFIRKRELLLAVRQQGVRDLLHDSGRDYLQMLLQPVHWREAFSRMDEDRDGKIDRNEFHRVFDEVSVALSEVSMSRGATPTSSRIGASISSSPSKLRRLVALNGGGGGNSAFHPTASSSMSKERRNHAAQLVQARFRGGMCRERLRPVHLHLEFDLEAVTGEKELAMVRSLRELFHLLDRNESDSITRNEVSHAMRSNDEVKEKVAHMQLEIPALRWLLHSTSWLPTFRVLSLTTQQRRQQERGRVVGGVSPHDMVDESTFVKFFLALVRQKAEEAALRESFRKIEVRLRTILKEVFHELDMHKDGVIDKQDVLEAMCSKANTLWRVSLIHQEIPELLGLLRPVSWRRVFKTINQSKTGRITAEELQRFYTSIKFKRRMEKDAKTRSAEAEASRLLKRSLRYRKVKSKVKLHLEAMEKAKKAAENARQRAKNNSGSSKGGSPVDDGTNAFTLRQDDAVVEGEDWERLVSVSNPWSSSVPPEEEEIDGEAAGMFDDFSVGARLKVQREAERYLEDEIGDLWLLNQQQTLWDFSKVVKAKEIFGKNSGVSSGEDANHEMGIGGGIGGGGSGGGGSMTGLSTGSLNSHARHHKNKVRRKKAMKVVKTEKAKAINPVSLKRLKKPNKLKQVESKVAQRSAAESKLPVIRGIITETKNGKRQLLHFRGTDKNRSRHNKSSEKSDSPEFKSFTELETIGGNMLVPERYQVKKTGLSSALSEELFGRVVVDEKVRQRAAGRKYEFVL